MNGIKRFFNRLMLAVIPPVTLLTGVYLYIDPFKVVHDYDDYYPHGQLSPGVNKGMIVIDNFDRNFDAAGYNSFIFGSSVSKYYRIDDWLGYLPEGAKAIHLDSSSEPLHSMHLKISYVLKRGAHIENALIVLPPEIFSFTEMEAPPFVNHWKIDPGRNRLQYQWHFLKSFYNREFIKGYVAGKLIGKPLNINSIRIFDTIPTTIDMLTNEEWHHSIDSLIDSNPEKYIQERKLYDFIGCMPSESASFISPHSLSDAKAIAHLLDSAGADYRVVIGPRLDKKYINRKDLALLREAFGKARVFDYSRILAGMSDSLNYFYDKVHYRSNVAREIMRRTYR